MAELGDLYISAMYRLANDEDDSVLLVASTICRGTFTAEALSFNFLLKVHLAPCVLVFITDSPSIFKMLHRIAFVFHGNMA